MRANLALDGGLVMAEAHMIALAPVLGREHAHDVVYEAATRARATRSTLTETLPELLAHRADGLADRAVAADDYLGDAVRTTQAAVAAWAAVPALGVDERPLSELATVERSVVTTG